MFQPNPNNAEQRCPKVRVFICVSFHILVSQIIFSLVFVYYLRRTMYLESNSCYVTQILHKTDNG